MNLYHVFAQQIASRADAIALIDAASERRWSYAELDNACANMAARMLAAGLGKGDAVLVFVPMSVKLYVALLACFRLGLVAVIIDPRAGAGHVDCCCALYPPKAFIGTAAAHLLRSRIASLRAIPHKFSTSRLVPAATYLPLDVTSRAPVAVAEVDDSAAALISFTSGSTATPKAALRSHGFLLAQQRAISRNHRAAVGSSNLTLFPVFVLSNLASGITSILGNVDMRRPERVDAGALLRDILRFRPGSLGAPPVVLSRIIQHCDRQSLQLLQDITVYTGGAPVFPALLKNFQRIAPNARLVSVYGSTEAEPIALNKFASAGGDNDCDSSAGGRGLPAGTPIAEIDLRIVRDSGRGTGAVMDDAAFADLCLGSGEIGEIVVSGEHVLKTYLNGLGDSENKYRVGDRVWHRTGDAGFLDAEGRLWLVGRCQARIEDARGITYPLGIEAAAQEVEHVQRAALIGVRGRRVLVIACATGHRALIAQAVRSLPIWSGIDSIKFLPSLPVDRRHNGKIDYARLHESY
jgi:acyl-CoA synthetase (AMP-forming)/AMP-acid ligase II